jgi:biopolymer transport protein ExbD
MKGNTFPLSGKDKQGRDVTKEEQAKSLASLKKELASLANKPGLKNPDGSSKVMVLVRGDRSTKWQYVQWVMQICAELKIYKIHFAIEHPPKDQ